MFVAKLAPTGRSTSAIVYLEGTRPLDLDVEDAERCKAKQQDGKSVWATTGRGIGKGSPKETGLEAPKETSLEQRCNAIFRRRRRSFLG